MSIYRHKPTQEYASTFYVDTQDDQRPTKLGGDQDMNNIMDLRSGGWDVEALCSFQIFQTKCE